MDLVRYNQRPHDWCPLYSPAEPVRVFTHSHIALRCRSVRARDSIHVASILTSGAMLMRPTRGRLDHSTLVI